LPRTLVDDNKIFYTHHAHAYKRALSLYDLAEGFFVADAEATRQSTSTQKAKKTMRTPTNPASSGIGISLADLATALETPRAFCEYPPGPQRPPQLRGRETG
jgi:hypothetical protein